MMREPRIFGLVLGLLVAAAVVFAGEVEEVVLRSLRVEQTQVVAVRRLGVGGVVPEQGLEPGTLEVSRNLLDLDLDHNLAAAAAGHLEEVGRSPPGAHILQVDLDQAGNFLGGEDNLRVGGLLVELGLIVSWEAEADVAAWGVG